jgi:hypothetical protein
MCDGCTPRSRRHRPPHGWRRHTFDTRRGVRCAICHATQRHLAQPRDHCHQRQLTSCRTHNRALIARTRRVVSTHSSRHTQSARGAVHPGPGQRSRKQARVGAPLRCSAGRQPQRGAQISRCAGQQSSHARARGRACAGQGRDMQCAGCIERAGGPPGAPGAAPAQHQLMQAAVRRCSSPLLLHTQTPWLAARAARQTRSTRRSWAASAGPWMTRRSWTVRCCVGAWRRARAHAGGEAAAAVPHRLRDSAHIRGQHARGSGGVCAVLRSLRHSRAEGTQALRARACCSALCPVGACSRRWRPACPRTRCMLTTRNTPLHTPTTPPAPSKHAHTQSSRSLAPPRARS